VRIPIAKLDLFVSHELYAMQFKNMLSDSNTDFKELPINKLLTRETKYPKNMNKFALKFFMGTY